MSGVRITVSTMTVLSLLASCTLFKSNEPEVLSPVLGVSDVAAKIPSHVKERRGWADAVVDAITKLDKRLTAERVCAVLAIIEQESGYQVDPVVKNLDHIVRQGLHAKLEPLGPLAKPALQAVLAVKIPDSSETFGERIASLRTEGDLDRLFIRLAATYEDRLPGPYAVTSALGVLFGKGSFWGLNPVTTAGSMQVKVDFAKKLLRDENTREHDIRGYLYTMEGGVRVGTARLIGYEAHYGDIIYRFADYNSGLYASRNAAFQKMLSDITGHDLALDGDIRAYDRDGDVTSETTKTLQAMLAFAAKHGKWEWLVRRESQKEKSLEFESTRIWRDVRAAWEAKMGKEAPYAIMPQVTLSSPKLSSDRSTTWFAENVKRRYWACRRR